MRSDKEILMKPYRDGTKPSDIALFGDEILKMMDRARADEREGLFTKEDMVNAAKYGYEFRDTTSFPEQKFEDACINNTKQWLEWYHENKLTASKQVDVEDDREDLI